MPTGTATVILTIPRNPRESLNITLDGCFVKNEANLKRFVEEFIDPSADRNKYENSKYIFYSPFSNLQGVVTEAVISYEKTLHYTKRCTLKTPLVITFNGHFFLCCDSKDLNKSLSKFLEECNKEVRINQTLNPTSNKIFFGLGIENGYLQFISFNMSQSQNDIYNVKLECIFDKLNVAGPLLLEDKKTVVGWYEKQGNCRIKTYIFGKSQGDPAPDLPPPGPSERHQEPDPAPPPNPSETDPAPDLPPPPNPSETLPAPDLPPPHPSETLPAPDLPPPNPSETHPAPDLPPPGPSETHPAPDLPPPNPSETHPAQDLPPSNPSEIHPVPGPQPDPPGDPTVRLLYNHFRLGIIRLFEEYITSEKITLAELKDHFLGLLPEEERRGANDVKTLVEALENRNVIGATRKSVELLKALAKVLKLEELKKIVEEFEAECFAGLFAVIHLKTLISAGVALASATLMYMYGRNPEELESLQLFKDFGLQLFTIFRGSVVFVLKVSSISSLRRLWQSYKNGSLKENLKKAFNEMKELKKVSQGEEIDVEVTIDEEEYREVLYNLILLEVKGKSVKNAKRQRRHSVCCVRDVPEDSSQPMVVKGKSVKNTKRQRRHSVCCERDVLEDSSEPVVVTQKPIRVEPPVTKFESRRKEKKPHSIPLPDLIVSSSECQKPQVKKNAPPDHEISEINLMAPSRTSTKKENLNFALLCRLLIDGGTRALREVFNSIYSPCCLHATLLSTSVHSTLRGLRARRILTTQQWGRLYPASRRTPVTSADFDITLLFVLLRNICGLTPPPTGWDNPPVAIDLSKEADLARVKYYRSELYGHTTKTAVSDSDFEKYWKEISDVLVRLGGPHYKPEIERLKIEAMDVEEEKYFIKILEEWEQTEQSFKTVIKNTGQRVMEKLEEMEDKPGNLESHAMEYTEKLKSSIKKQTNFLLTSEEGDKKIRTDDIFTNVTIERGKKQFKKPEEMRSDRRQMDEIETSRTKLTTCSGMFVIPGKDDQKSTS